MTGKTLGHYEISSQLAEGGMLEAFIVAAAILTQETETY
jgi:hypothetical protein